MAKIDEWDPITSQACYDATKECSTLWMEKDLDKMPGIEFKEGRLNSQPIVR